MINFSFTTQHCPSDATIWSYAAHAISSGIMVYPMVKFGLAGRMQEVRG